MGRLRSKLTYANVMATIAVFIALGGASYAAMKLPKNSVGTKQLKSNAVTAAKIKNGVITAAKLDGSSMAALTGPRGLQGEPGAPGTAKAWAEVNSDAEIVRSSGNITAAQNENHAGWVCIDAGSFNTSNSVAVATLNYSDPGTGINGQIMVSTGADSNECPAGQFMVITGRNNGEEDPMGFIIAIL